MFEVLGSPAMMPVISPPPELYDGLERFGLLASAIVGRPVQIEALPEGDAAYSDGRRIYASPSHVGSVDGATVVVQAALIAAGSHDASVMRRLVGRPALARRYLAVEGWRALRLLTDVLPGLPIIPQSANVGDLPDSPAGSLAAAKSRREVPLVPDIFGVLRPGRVVAAQVAERSGGAPSANDVQPKIRPDLPEADDVDDGEDEDEDQQSSTLLKLFSSVLSFDLFSKIFQGPDGKKAQSVSASDGGAWNARMKTAVSDVRSRTMVSLAVDALTPTQSEDSRGGGWRYPEWDVHARHYRKHWCTVREVLPDSRPFRRPAPNPELRRSLARVSVGLQRRRRQPNGAELDLDAVIEARTAFLAGVTASDNLYIDTQRRRRGLDVFVLLDISGSEGEQASQYGTAHDQQAHAAAALVDTLHSLGDRVALYGFRSQGRSSVLLFPIKDFDEAITGETFDRLGGLQPAGYTRLGAGIRHGSHLLATKAGTERRLLVVLSDGYPYEDGYEGAYAVADSRRALAEARSQGIGCLCLTLGASTPPGGLGQVFGAAAHASAPRLDDLSKQIVPLFRRAMASADVQRRISQRHRQDEHQRRGTA